MTHPNLINRTLYRNSQSWDYDSGKIGSATLAVTGN